MQRDKRGRFIKKAQSGMTFTLNGKEYKVKPEATQAFTKVQSKYKDINEWLATLEGQEYLEAVNPTPTNGLSLNNPTFGKISAPKIEVPDLNDPLGTKQKKAWEVHDAFSAGTDYLSSLAPEKIEYSIGPNGYQDSMGRPISIMDVVNNPHRYKAKDILGVSENASTDITEETSNGRNVDEVTPDNKVLDVAGKVLGRIDKTKLADYLEYARAGIGASINNKIADRALKAEKPFLQDISESHRSVYGDYRAQIQGEKAAAQLRNMASKPLTSDGALQQQMMMEAQIKGQEYIDQGNAKDDAMIKQTREVAWQQEKENQQQRQAVAMQNKQAILMSEKNKSQIENMRDSANYSQVVSPLLAAKEQRLRNKGVEQEYYQDYYNDALIQNDVYANFRDGLSETQKTLIDTYQTSGVEGLTKYLTDNKLTESDWIQTQRILNNEVIRRKAALKGAYINPTSLNPTVDPYAYWKPTPMNFKRGGTIYRAKLSKRTKDNDRGARSIESSKKIAARFLEKAIDSLYNYNDVELIAKPKNKRKRKYQAGGGLPFVGFTPVFASSETGAPSAAAKAKAEKEDKDDLTTKDILTLLKDMDGLPSDMQLIVSSLQNFALQDKMDPLNLSSSADIASRYISLINKVKVAKFNKDEYNSAFNQLKGNGGLTEFAITSEGMLIGTNAEGDFEYFTPEEASKGEHSKEGYQLLTNSNLLYLRANSLDAAFNHKLTTVAQNGIGIETVNKLILDAITNLGSTSSSEEGYAKTKQGELIKGLEDFYKAAQASGGAFDGTVNDLYKGKFLTKSQAEQAKKAMQYIYSTLPSNARALLKVKSDGSESGALKLIETLITSKEVNQTQFDVDLVGGKTHKSTNTTGKDNSDLESSLPLNILKNVGGVDTYLDIDRGDGIHMSVRGTQFNLIKTPNGEPISDTSLSSMLQQSGLQSIVKDMRNIQFGDQKISPEALAFITYNNTGITRANLPIKADGTVNLALLEAYEKAERDIDLSGDKSPENVKSVYEQYGITSLLNADGTYNQSKFAPFMVTEGYTTDALSGVKESDFVVEFKGNTDAAVALMQKSLAVGSGKNVTTPEIDEFSWYNPADWFGWTDTVFKGVVYIPITNNVNTAVFGANQSLDYDEALAQEEKYQNFEKMSSQRSTDASLLNI